MVTFNDNIQDLKDAQEADHDQRKFSREQDHFVNKEDGMWEPAIVQKMGNRPRYTFDQITPVIDQIMGDISNADFAIKVSGRGSEASKNTASVYEGLIRDIEDCSNAQTFYEMMTRECVTTGISGMRIVTDWPDYDSFDQELQLKFISNFNDRVWFDPNFEEQTASDAEYCFVLSSLTMAAYEKNYPKGSRMSVCQDRFGEVYAHKKPNEVIIGERLYKVRKKRNLVLLSNGSIYDSDSEEFQQIKDEIFLQGVEVERTREREVVEVKSRKFDGDGWLGAASDTVFRYLPVIPMFANFKVSENKVTYRGVVKKMMDANRVLNFSDSRLIEEVASSPRGKYWATKKQVSGNEQGFETLNTNNKSVQTYTYDPNVPGPPVWQGAPVANPGLLETSRSAINHIRSSGGMFSANMGDSPASRSGVAIDSLQERGNNGAYKYFSALQTTLQHVGKVLVDSAPRVYDTPRELTIKNVNGTQDTTVINQVITDMQTGQQVVVNDLSKGNYEVKCIIGPAFKSQQKETVSAINELSKVDPSIIQIGGDILLNNVEAPGMQELAKRKRWLMIQQGFIPDSDLTQEELQRVQAMRQQQVQQGPTEQEKAMLMMAEAENKKAEVQAVAEQSKVNERMRRLELEFIKLQQKNREIDINEREAMLKVQGEQNKAILDTINGQAEDLKKHAETLKILREAMGADAVISESVANAYNNQARIIQKEQVRQ